MESLELQHSTENFLVRADERVLRIVNRVFEINYFIAAEDFEKEE